MSEFLQQPAAKASPDKGWAAYKRLLGYAKPHWRPFLLGLAGFGLFSSSYAAIAWGIEWLVNNIEAGHLDHRGPAAAGLLLLFAMRGVGSFLGNYGLGLVGRNVVHALRMDVFDRLLVLPSEYYHRSSSGDMLAQLTFHVEQVTQAVTQAIQVLLREGLTVIAVLGYMFYLNAMLTFIFLGSAPLIAVLVAYAAKRLRRISRRIQNSVGDITNSASETIKGHQVVRIFGGTDFERERFHQASEHNRRQSMKLVLTQAINTPLVQMFVAIALALLLYIAMQPSVFGEMAPGAVAAFLTSAGLAAKPLRTLTNINSAIQRGIAAAETVFAVIDEPAEIDEGGNRTHKVEGVVKFSALTYQYPTATEPALRDIDLSIRAGQTVALVGRSGSGKSTLVSLLPRFLHGWQGQITLDEIPLQEYDLKNLREQIALVNQQVVLFNGTIAQNIAYGSMKDSSEDKIMAAADAAHVTPFVKELPNGIHTMIGEDGVLLSGGQRQRIAIARAILKNAPILILDEATSALDTESERHIQAAMHKVMQNRTTLVIAHRLSTIEQADKIVVLDQGHIVEQGSHAELLAAGKAYAHLHALQFNEETDT